MARSSDSLSWILTVIYKRVSSFRRVFDLFYKYSISGTEIKKFKELPFLVGCTEIVVFSAGEEVFGNDSGMQEKMRTWLLRVLHFVITQNTL